MIKNLIFDFGHVLVTYDNARVVNTLFDSQEEADAFNAVFSSPEFVRRSDMESIPFAELIREMQSAYPHWAQQWQAIYDRYLELVTGEMPGMYAYLTELKGRGYKLYGLSNWCSLVYEVMKQYPIFGLLDGFVVSCDYQMIKPDPAIYTTLLEKYNLRAEDCLFADDKAANVEAAKLVGMQGVVFTTTEEYRRALEESEGI